MNIKKLLTRIILAITALITTVSPFSFNIGSAEATVAPTNWNHVIPFTITDTSGVARTNVPVIISYDVNGRIVAYGLSNASFTNTYMDSSGASNSPIGSGMALNYLGATSNITTVIPSLPAYGSVTTNLYTGYSPSQTSFPIITGYSGYVTRSDSVNLELASSGNVSSSSMYIDTSVDSTLFSHYDLTNGGILVSTLSTGKVEALILAPPAATNLYTGWADANDGVYNFGAVYATVHNAASGTVNADLQIGQRVVGADSYIYRGFVRFNTSNISSAEPVISAVLHLRGSTDESTTDFVITVVNGQTNSRPTNPLAVTDYNYTYYSGSGGTLNTSAFVIGDNLITLNATGLSWIKRDGYTMLGLFSSRDISSTPPAPANNEYVICNPANTYLTVTFLDGTSTTINAVSNDYSIAAGVTGGNLKLTLGSTSNTTAWAGAVPNSTSNWTFGTGFPYCTDLSITVNGTRQLYYAPNAIISGSTLPDREATGGLQNGTIIWGTNSGITITGGDIATSSSATTVGTTTAQLQSTFDYLGTYTTVYLSYEYGLTTTYGTSTSEVAAIAAQTFTVSMTGLSPNTTYHYRVLARSGSVFAYGADISFTTSSTSAGGGSTNPTINSVNIFRNYITPTAGDILVVVDISCSYPPYYPNLDPAQYFQVDLIATNGVSILGASPIRNWGERPESIYFNSAFVTSNITWGSAYYVKLISTTANVTVSYTLTSTNWKGYDLSILDKWCISTAKSMELSDQVTTGTYVVNTTGQGEQISDSAGSWFTVGIPSIGTIRPNLFTTAQSQKLPVAGTSSNTWDKADASPTGWRSYVGVVIAADIDNMALPWGVTGKDFASFLVIVAVIGCIMLVVGSTGGFGALGAVMLAVPIIWLGTWFRMVPVALIIFTVLFLGLLAIRQFIIKPL